MVYGKFLTLKVKNQLCEDEGNESVGEFSNLPRVPEVLPLEDHHSTGKPHIRADAEGGLLI
jgi:hypothetical protein